MEKIDNWFTSFRIRKLVAFKKLRKELETLDNEAFDFLYVRSKTSLTKKLIFRWVPLFFTILFFVLTLFLVFYGNVVAVRNELHSVLSKENMELFQTVVNVGVGSLLMVSAFWLVIFCSIVRGDIKKLETKIVLMELMHKK
ncbi:TPA: hypothetical protein I0F65_RS03065 [Enterococcus faecalis]|uniref:Uncharacterized protein n=1 Tax=Enterococcus faecalis ATCC 6055 TaxID=1169311 RepID=R3I0E1_ENTFL|nr:hypothetical protein [Enterococcus faecalis]EGO2704995.1 hypothetical protein [Enterococcus faecalis]EIQ7117106.1 hypothetical protein [Enterococcus faecalis]EOK11362.1 hypothetical protein WOU_02107 [Enterococcus faecalis ATCC 6055]OTP14002.1 hypothetical protein A5830_001949 [Enterococcus faecalis]HBI1661419.1 hypothetical protein [Enterococcus faecalis]